MKKILLATTVLAFASGAAFAQTITPLSQGGTASATPGAASVDETNDNSSATVVGESAIATADNTDAGINSIAVAEVGNGITAATFGDGVGAPNVGSTDVNGQSANANVQFQVGNNNQAVNMQEGIFQESTTLQIGDDNRALISQTNNANEAAIAQVGNSNDGVVVQDGLDNGAALAQLGDGNSAFALQTDSLNFAAHSQVGNNNDSVSFQAGDGNTVASLQEGDGNVSFISQGGGIAVALSDITGASWGAGLPGGATISGSGIGAPHVGNNAAANMQLGTNNSSAILQVGDSNTAVNYQNNE